MSDAERAREIAGPCVWSQGCPMQGHRCRPCEGQARVLAALAAARAEEREAAAKRLDRMARESCPHEIDESCCNAALAKAAAAIRAGGAT